MTDDAAHPTAHADAHTTAPTTSPRERRRARPWIVATAAVLLGAGVVSGAAYGWSVFAQARFTVANQQSVQVAHALTDVSDQRGAAIDKAKVTTSAVDSFVAQPHTGYVSAAALDALKKADNDLHSASNDLTYAPEEVTPVPSRPSDLWPLTVIRELLLIRTSTDGEVALLKSRAAELAAMKTAQKEVGTASTAVYGEVKAHAEATMKAAVDATYESRIGLAHALAGASGSVSFSGMGLPAIISASDAVAASEAAGQAAKQDPAYPAHAAIEAYARSIAHGVNLDFQWHQVVGGYGTGWYSGTTMYHEGDGGWATIDLNFDTVDGWSRGDVDAKALITHEVGHSQVVRPECRTLFTGPVFNSDDEMWATAWAISMGFDDEGSGIQAYGRPSDQQIATAGQCR